MNKLYLGIYLCLICILSACTDAEMAKNSGFGSSYRVDMVNCDGTITHSWTSSGKVLSEANTDGYYFNEKGSGRLIEVSGTLIITKLD